MSSADEKASAKAAAANNHAALHAILQRGVSVNTRALFSMRFEMNGMAAGTPEAKLPLLLIATQSGATECVKLLLDARADAMVDVKIQGMGTAFDSCFQLSRTLRRPYNLDVAKLLLEARVDPNVHGRQPDGCTEFMMLCQDGELGAARFLLDHGADPNLGKHNGSTALFKAAQNGHADICRMLLGAHAHVDARFSSGATPLGVAACGGHEAVIRVLLSSGADTTVVASDGLSPSGMARSNGHHALATLLAKPLIDPPEGALVPGSRITITGVQAKPELNGQSATVLEFDRTTGRYSIALWAGSSIALKPVNVVPTGGTAGAAAVDVTDGESRRAAAPRSAPMPVRPYEVWALLGNGQQVDWACDLIARRDFDLAYAFPTPANQREGAGQTTHLLAQAAACMRKVNPNGLAEASNVVGMPHLLRTLLESKADVNSRTASGTTALHLACGSCLTSHVAVLMEHGADVNAGNECNGPPLMQTMVTHTIATDEWRVACVNLLASTGKLEARAAPALTSTLATEGATSGSCTSELWAPSRCRLLALACVSLACLCLRMGMCATDRSQRSRGIYHLHGGRRVGPHPRGAAGAPRARRVRQHGDSPPGIHSTGGGLRGHHTCGAVCGQIAPGGKGGCVDSLLAAQPAVVPAADAACVGVCAGAVGGTRNI